MVSCSRDAPPGASAVFRAVLYLSIYLSICALSYREGFSRIGRSSREHHVLPVSDKPDKVADSHNLMVVLAHLQGVAATFRVGRHHHRGPLHEGRGLTHALTHIAPTDLTVAAALVRKACSKRRRSRLWSKPVNLRTCGLVSDFIAIVQAFAELRYGAVVHTVARKQCEIWGRNF